MKSLRELGTAVQLSLIHIFIGMISKVIGCGLCAKLFRYKNKDAMKIGVGMMTRGEVALIVSQKGLNVGLMEPVYFCLLYTSECL